MGSVFSCFRPSPSPSPPHTSKSIVTPEEKVTPDSSVKSPVPASAPVDENSLQPPSDAQRPLSLSSAVSSISATDVLSTALNAAQFASQFAPVPGLGAGITVLQGIVAAFAQVQFNREKCEVLKNRSEEVYQAINEAWKPEEEKHLFPAANRFIALLTEIRKSMEYYASLSRFDSFLYQFSITSDIESKLSRLDASMGVFNVASQMQLHKWNQEFAAASQKDSSFLQEILESQREAKNLNEANRDSLTKVLGDLQMLLRQQPPGTAQQESTKHQILTIQSMTGVGLPQTNLLSKIECERVGNKPLPSHNSSMYEIWEGLWMGKQKVALKVLRGLRVEDMEKYQRRTDRQVGIWSKLNNDYILPLYGICKDDGPFPYLVSPWCSNGDATRYLADKSTAERLKICLDIAYGLDYLHHLKEPIVHGAIKGENVLISDDGKALLADFGVSNLIESPFTQSNGPGANYRWMAPEIQGGGGNLTKACDVWSWGMTTLELITGKPPFNSIRMPGTVLIKVAQGERPDPKEFDIPILQGELWSLLVVCWHKDPEKRPSIKEVVTKMEGIVKSYSGS